MDSEYGNYPLDGTSGEAGVDPALNRCGHGNVNASFIVMNEFQPSAKPLSAEINDPKSAPVTIPYKIIEISWYVGPTAGGRCRRPFAINVQLNIAGSGIMHYQGRDR